MSKVFVNIGLSLDGFMAPDGMTMNNPAYKNWGAKWGAMMSMIAPFNQTTQQAVLAARNVP